MARGNNGFLRVLMAFVLALGLMPMPAYADEVEPNDDAAMPDNVGGTTGGPSYVEGEVLVGFDEMYSGQKALSLMDENAVEGVSALTKSREVVSEDEDGAVVLMELQDGVSVEQAVEEISRDPKVAYAQPNYLYHLMDEDVAAEDAALAADDAALPAAEEAATNVVPLSDPASPLMTMVNDPFAGEAADSTTENQWWLYSVNAFDAWDMSKCDNNVTVAVLDTGINFEQADLSANIDRAHAYDAEAGAPLTKSPADTNAAHGTHVAGIIAAQANNGTQFAGVSYNANILPVNVFYYDSWEDDYYAKTSTLVTGYQYLKGLVNDGSLNDLHVINMSLGGYGSLDSTDRLLENEIAAMDELGVVTVCAGGNGDDYGNPLTNPSYPADFDECVSVVALKSTDVRASWSDYNSYKDIAAPGVNIWSTWLPGSEATYRASGTSMASPVVAGCLALLFASQPDMSATDAKQALYDTATDLGAQGYDEYYGWGKVDAKNLLASLRGANILSPTDDAFYVTQTRQLSAELFTNYDEDPAIGTDWTWSVDKPTIATISDDGVLSARSEGTVTVTVTAVADPTIIGKKTLTVKPIAIPDGIAAAATSKAIEVSWAPAPAADSYAVYRAKGNKADGNWELVTTIDAESGQEQVVYKDGAVDVAVPYYYRVIPQGTMDGKTVTGKASNNAVALFKGAVMELAGSDRYQTTSAVANLFTAEKALDETPIDTVVIASGVNFPDALAASGLAGIQDAPIVLTPSDRLTDEAKSMLQSVDPSKVIVTGGEGAVSEEVFEEIKATVDPSTTVRRLAGSDRFKTANAIYDEERGSWGTTAIIASGNNERFGDVLSAAPYSYATNSPIFLVDSNSATGLLASTLQKLRAGGFTRVILVGGTLAVPERVEEQLGRNGIEFERWSGENRYVTSETIARKAIEEGALNAGEIGVATGVKPFDSLSAGAFLGMQGNPLVLMDGSETGMCATKGILADQKGTTKSLLFFGGKAVVPQDVRDAAQRAVGLD